MGTEYFKHGIQSPFFFSSKCSLFHNSKVFGSCIFHILYTGCAKIKKIIPAPKVNIICHIYTAGWKQTDSSIKYCKNYISFILSRTPRLLMDVAADTVTGSLCYEAIVLGAAIK